MSTDRILTNFCPSGFSFLVLSVDSLVATKIVTLVQLVIICLIIFKKRFFDFLVCNKLSALSRIKYGETESLIKLNCFKRKSSG